MKCPKCGQEIPDYSTFCPQCGTPVNQNSQSAQSQSAAQVDEYHFIPTTVAVLKPFSRGPIFMFIGLVILTLLLLLPTRGIVLLALLLLIFPLRMGAKAFPMTFVHKKLCHQADYIQDPDLFKNERYIRIKKNNLMGLYDQKEQKILAPAEYESMTWDMKDRTLDVTVNGRPVKIDIYGNQLK